MQALSTIVFTQYSNAECKSGLNVINLMVLASRMQNGQYMEQACTKTLVCKQLAYLDGTCHPVPFLAELTSLFLEVSTLK
jgi:hypothetical protein